MKIFRRIVIWALISLVLQFAGLFYINNYFLSSNTKLETKKVLKSEPKKSNVVIKIPQNANNIKVSFDGKYVSYYAQNVITVIDTETGYEKQITFKSGVDLSFYKWLKDRNRILIAEKQSSDSDYSFNIEYYDVDKDIKENIKKIDGFNSKTQISDIQESPLTNVIYIKMVSTGKGTNIYRVNIMSEVQKVQTQSYMIGDIGILALKDALIYEDSLYNRIYVSGQDESLKIQGVKNPTWVGVDGEDRIYLGDLKNGKITKLYYGNIDGQTNQYSVLDLKEEVDKKDVYVSDNGNIYVNDNLQGIVRNVTNGKQYKYYGKFVQMYEGGIVSVDNEKLEKVLIQ
ncbi:hypothetical protein KM800_12115 [Clostridium tyrobutyricum]|uniref:hypothetical protein n=1 Tax=Clostridium tyrobutyricum TaxID=1519 RepID=UPI001C386D94|nr:hypothetical protein [Clostridium tyrobutyricum]MBV4420059.1 hypothetical protein [Clostridium tyrobutyricum]